MVSIKEATANALVFAREALGPERTADARLEEIASSKVACEDAWLITLSMVTRDNAAGTLGNVAAPPSISLQAYLNSGKREYKTFTVRKRDGEVLAMKIRELADA